MEPPTRVTPRYVFKRLLKKVADKGYTFYIGPELEFFYFKDNKSTEVMDAGGYFDARPWTWGATSGERQSSRSSPWGLRWSIATTR